MNSYKVAEIKENIYFTSDVVIDGNFVILPQYVAFSSILRKALLDWNFKNVLSDGQITDTIYEAEELEEEKSVEKDLSSISEKIKETIENSTIQNETKDVDKNRFSIVNEVYNEYMNYISHIYTHYATHKEFDLPEISSTVKEMCVFIKENRRYMLRVEPTMEARNKNFLVTHAMRSTVFAITIGLQLRLPLSRLVELGVACILHEIGQIRLPPQLYLSNRPLTPAEKKIMNTHPVLSYEILKSSNFPLSITLAALEHHERENGTGYPRHLNGPQISMYAKIISVACTFEAITAPRHYKSAQTAYAAMVDMLKNSGKEYDGTVIKALLYSMSFYPIGSYAYLSNGKVCQIVDANPTDPRNPIVHIMGEKDEQGEPKKVITTNNGLKIVRVLNKQEIADIIKK